MGIDVGVCVCMCVLGCLCPLIHSFTVLQVVPEHLLEARHWIGPQEFNDEQDRFGPCLWSQHPRGEEEQRTVN